MDHVNGDLAPTRANPEPSAGLTPCSDWLRSLPIHTWSPAVEPATGSLSTPTRHLDGSREPLPVRPHGLPREARARLGRLLWLWGIFLLLGPPASTWAVSVSLTGARPGDQAQRFGNPLGGCKTLISNIGEQGCVRSVSTAMDRLSGGPHSRGRGPRNRTRRQTSSVLTGYPRTRTLDPLIKSSSPGRSEQTQDDLRPHKTGDQG